MLQSEKVPEVGNCEGVSLLRHLEDIWRHAVIYGLCRGWGVIVEHEYGWRCQNAAIEHLYVPSDIRDRLPAWSRDVPIGVLPPLEYCSVSLDELGLRL